MKKKFFITIGVVVLILGAILFKILQPTPVWEKNAQEFADRFNIISGNKAVIDDLSGFTAFEWDTLYSFGPYVMEETIYETVGYRWDKIHSGINEGMNQLVFLEKGKVVCHIDGYPEKYKVFFDFGQYSGPYFKLTSSDKLAFTMTLREDGIRKFEYIK